MPIGDYPDYFSQRDIQGLCLSCSMTRQERMQYPGNCPMNCPEHGCPFYDPPRSQEAPK